MADLTDPSQGYDAGPSFSEARKAFLAKNSSPVSPTEKQPPALNKTEYLILWLLKHGKADGKIKRKGTISAFNQKWDLDLTLKLDKTKQKSQQKPRVKKEPSVEELLF